ncbi:peptidoglycan editing factor PgeF [Priestia endophytica]|uniref:Purine nucleoside phosphorylase n=1 Tax=Priestia endophytica TaxID=135735 RepID=A0AAX1QB89_9BACI|nr:peptidoglycan editing factor PgeF [Priestia endophytica]RAS79430.1 laccase [Priestia endophytica]
MEPFVKSKKETLLSLEPWESKYANLTAGFTTKKGGVSSPPYESLNLGLHVNDSAKDVVRNRHIVAEQLSFPLESWVCAEQVHGTNIQKVTMNDKGKGTQSYSDGIAKCDGIYTKDPSILLSLCFADCVPLYFIAPNYHCIGLAHAGWRGTVGNIAGEMISSFKSEGIQESEIFVTIGPSIGGCCYIVNDEVIDLVKTVLDDRAGSAYNEVEKGQYTLNLQKVNKHLLLQAGIAEENILLSSRCTSCESETFFSHRRDEGKTGRMFSFIGYKESVNL